jgi:hypothetical protein
MYETKDAKWWHSIYLCIVLFVESHSKKSRRTIDKIHKIITNIKDNICMHTHTLSIFCVLKHTYNIFYCQDSLYFHQFQSHLISTRWTQDGHDIWHWKSRSRLGTGTTMRRGKTGLWIPNRQHPLVDGMLICLIIPSFLQQS